MNVQDFESTKLALFSKQLSEKYFNDGNFGRSFAHILVCLTVRPEWKSYLEDTFTLITKNWCEILYEDQRYGDLISSFNKAFEEYPNNIVLLNTYGYYLVGLGQIDQAYEIIKSAIKINPNDLLSERNLNQIKDQLVPRWHFRMLNDKTRNDAYKCAIYKKISNGFDSVLDIGTGTGLLSVFASSGGAKIITACDYSKTMVDIAEKVFYENNIRNVNLVHSSSLNLTNVTFEKANLIITEIFDAGGLGEDVIQCVSHALQNLVLENACVIPESMIMYVTAVESNTLRRKSKIIKTTTNATSLNVNINLQSRNSEPYDTENLRVLKDVKYITDPTEIYTINFNDSKSLKQLNTDKNTTLKCTTSGRVDAFAVWMKLNLDDTISINSDPRTDDIICSWDQAIYFPKKPFSVAENEFVPIVTNCLDALQVSSANDCENNILEDFLKVPECILTFLNDDLFMENLNACANILVNSYEVRNLILLDLSNIPIIGLLLLKYGAKQLYCMQTNRNVIEKIAALNFIPNNIIYIDNNFTNIDTMFDLIILNLIDETGELQQDCLQQVALKRYLVAGGIMLPYKINICGKLIQSNHLDRMSAVQDENTSNYKISKFINEFQINKHIDFDINTLNYINASDDMIFSNVKISEQEVCEELPVKIIQSCCVNAIVYWYEIYMTESSKCYSTFNSSSFIKNVAFLLESKVIVKADDILNVITRQKEGIFKIIVQK